MSEPRRLNSRARRQVAQRVARQKTLLPDARGHINEAFGAVQTTWDHGDPKTVAAKRTALDALTKAQEALSAFAERKREDVEFARSTRPSPRLGVLAQIEQV